MLSTSLVGIKAQLAQAVAVFVRASSVIIPGVNNSVSTGPRSEVTTSSTRFALKISSASNRSPAALNSMRSLWFAFL